MICMIRGCKGRESFLESEISKLDAELHAFKEDAQVQEEQCNALTKANNAKVDEMSARHLAYVAWAEAEIDKMDAVITKLREELSAGSKSIAPNLLENMPVVDNLNTGGYVHMVQTDDGDLVCVPHGDKVCSPASN